MLRIKKTLLESLIYLASGVIVSSIVYLVMGMGFAEIVDKVTYIIIILAYAFLGDDLIFKWLHYRDLLVWQYFLGFIAMLGCVYLFQSASMSTTWLDMWLRIGGCVVLAVGVFFYDLKIYNIVIASPKELDEMELSKHSNKWGSFDSVAISKDLAGFLRFAFSNDDPEGGIDVSRPLDPEGLQTLDELKKESKNTQLIESVSNYETAIAAKIVAGRS
jgi:predicted membrane channel-forming protein YqfA (hemolysin III family)